MSSYFDSLDLYRINDKNSIGDWNNAYVTPPPKKASKSFCIWLLSSLWDLELSAYICKMFELLVLCDCTTRLAAFSNTFCWEADTLTCFWSHANTCIWLNIFRELSRISYQLLLRLMLSYQPLVHSKLWRLFRDAVKPCLIIWRTFYVLRFLLTLSRVQFWKCLFECDAF